MAKFVVYTSNVNSEVIVTTSKAEKETVLTFFRRPDNFECTPFQDYTKEVWLKYKNEVWRGDRKCDQYIRDEVDAPFFTINSTIILDH